MSALYLDVGNTRIKWARRVAGSVLSDSSKYSSAKLNATPSGDWLTGYLTPEQLTDHNWPQLCGLDSGLDCGAGLSSDLGLESDAISRLVVASVRQHPQTQQLLQSQFGSRLIWLSQPLTTLPDAIFKHCYPQPERLGVDRWLAMLGARQFNSELTDSEINQVEGYIVVDAGTALTADLVSVDGHHLGGWIVPGLQLAQRALFQQTDRVNPYADEAQPNQIAPGQATYPCVDNGVRRQLLALVQSIMLDYPRYQPLVCGGDGPWLVQALNQTPRSSKVRHQPELIFAGMEYLCDGSFLP